MGWFGKKRKRQKKEAAAVEVPAATETEGAEPADAEPADVEPADAGIDDSDTPPAADNTSAALPEESLETASTSEKKPSKGFFQQLKRGLSKTREVLTTDIDDLFRGGKKLDDALLEEIEELLITSDMGVSTTMTLMERIEKNAKGITDADSLKAVIKTEICALMDKPMDLPVSAHTPHVIMVVGVNGVGKTTTIGKLAARFTAEGKSVLIGAADTFRAAAVEQLSIWAERAGVDIVRHRENADPAAVAYDSVEAAAARGKEVVIIDTAGRLHTKVNLMEELKKIKRAVAKKIPDAPHETYLVIDATTGQNALSQAKLFNASMGITGLILTKLDGTAKGGVVVAICDALEIPLVYIGVGEGVDDLQKFDPEQFTEALFS